MEIGSAYALQVWLLQIPALALAVCIPKLWQLEPPESTFTLISHTGT
jgi:Ca2+/H+ antiporter